MDLAMAGYLSVQSLPRRVRICALPASSRACIRYPSNLISCNHSEPSGGSLTSLASCGLIQVGGGAGSALRRVEIVSVRFAREDFAIETDYQNFGVLSARYELYGLCNDLPVRGGVKFCHPGRAIVPTDSGCRASAPHCSHHL